jgi:copper chaperone CopZ
LICPGCEATVEAVLDGVDGVVTADADRTTQTALVRFNAERTTPEQLAEAINRRTYYLASVGASGVLPSTAMADAATAPTTASRPGAAGYTVWALAALVLTVIGVLLVTRRSRAPFSPVEDRGGGQWRARTAVCVPW